MWFTDAQIAGIQAFAGLTADQIEQTSADSGALYARITASPGVDDAALRTWAEGAGVTPERYNRAVAALREAGVAVDFAGGGIGPLPTQAAASLRDVISGPALVPGEVFTQAELAAAAKRMKLDVAKSAPKSELMRAIADAS